MLGPAWLLARMCFAHFDMQSKCTSTTLDISKRYGSYAHSSSSSSFSYITFYLMIYLMNVYCLLGLDDDRTKDERPRNGWMDEDRRVTRVKNPSMVTYPTLPCSVEPDVSLKNF